MGGNNCWEREVVITELTKGEELMLQLQKHFDPMKQVVCWYLAEQILSSLASADKALATSNVLSSLDNLTTLFEHDVPETFRDAALAYDAETYKLSGESAKLNFPHCYNNRLRIPDP